MSQNSRNNFPSWAQTTNSLPAESLQKDEVPIESEFAGKQCHVKSASWCKIKIQVIGDLWGSVLLSKAVWEEVKWRVCVADGFKPNHWISSYYAYAHGVGAGM